MRFVAAKQSPVEVLGLTHEQMDSLALAWLAYKQTLAQMHDERSVCNMQLMQLQPDPDDENRNRLIFIQVRPVRLGRHFSRCIACKRCTWRAAEPAPYQLRPHCSGLSLRSHSFELSLCAWPHQTLRPRELVAAQGLLLATLATLARMVTSPDGCTCCPCRLRVRDPCSRARGLCDGWLPGVALQTQ